jgi:hypothetical protein
VGEIISERMGGIIPEQRAASPGIGRWAYPEMTLLRQIEANRRNSQKSTGPKTEQGKRQSRRNAMRHGLCAETVIEILEDIDDYKSFEAAIIADYDAQTAVERELVLRLASLLWRIRRATSIESDLLRIQAESLHARRDRPVAAGQAERGQNVLYRVLRAAASTPRAAISNSEPRQSDDTQHARDESDAPIPASRLDPSRDLTHAFQRLVNLDSGVFERLGRYEAALWRQTVQTIFALRLVRRRSRGIRDE